MWESNVVLLRRCLSAARHGPRSRCYSSSTSAVSELEFVEAYEKVLPRDRWRRYETIGLAVSGGVDSMALATLYMKARQMNFHMSQLHGIIIDHKVRPGSTEEAKWVAEQLHVKSGIDSTIIALTWPTEHDVLTDTQVTTGRKLWQPLAPSNFESRARELRYQALGRLCAEKNIQSLMTGHHGDDQAETICQRLAMKRWRSGLAGMNQLDWIPECYGIHGIYHSGRYSEHGLNLPLPLERGGIQVFRPLLSFEKSRLVATCEENGTAWAEDMTNQDTEVTPRNAIRHIMRHHKLPLALSKTSLVSLGVRMKERVDTHRIIADRLFDDCPMKLDIQTGSLLVQFPPVTAFLNGEIQTESDKHHARNTAFILVKRIAKLVASKEKTSASRLGSGIDIIYPSLSTNLELSERQDFCAFGVWFRKWKNPFLDETPRHDGRPWLLCRQPLEKTEQALAKTLITVPCMHVDPTAGEKWHLFDARYWIRLKNYGEKPLKIRLFQRDDVLELQRDIAKVSPSDRPRVPPDIFVKTVLSLVETTVLHHGFPGIYRTDDQGRDILVALPTFNVMVNPPTDTVNEQLRFDIRYRKIELGNRSPEEIILRGVTKTDITNAVQKLTNEPYKEKHFKPSMETATNTTTSIKYTISNPEETSYKDLSLKTPSPKS